MSVKRSIGVTARDTRRMTVVVYRKTSPTSSRNVLAMPVVYCSLCGSIVVYADNSTSLFVLDQRHTARSQKPSHHHPSRLQLDTCHIV